MSKTNNRIVSNFKTLARHGLYGVARMKTKNHIVKTNNHIVKTKSYTIKTNKHIVRSITNCFYLIN